MKPARRYEEAVEAVRKAGNAKAAQGLDVLPAKAQQSADYAVDVAVNPLPREDNPCISI